MFRKLFILGLCLIMTACASQRMNDEDNNDTMQQAALTDADAYKLGMQYLLGKGVPQNYGTAANYFEKSASMGNPYAANQLGFMYVSGKGVQRNYATAIEWYQKAALRGVANAQYNLGIMYLHGLGTPVNTVEARKWLHLAAQHGFNPQNLSSR
jgi:TPR repeat protein